MSTDSRYPKLPDSFDVIVCGTGLPESLVAAALSRVGKTVLHLDRNDYYGSYWSTFTFKSLLDWIHRYQTQEENETKEISNDDTVPLKDVCIKNVVVHSYIPEKNRIEETQVNETEESLLNSSRENDSDITAENVIEKNEAMTVSEISNEDTSKTGDGEDNSTSTPSLLPDHSEQNVNIPIIKSQKPLSMVSQAKIKQKSDDISLEDLQILSRKFNLDITTKFLYSAGPLVKSIIKANISHYAEFKVVNRILTWKDDQIMEVPCNRADVFSSTFLSMIEKRTLMKFLTFCLEQQSETSDAISSFNGKPFKEFLQSHRLSENLQRFVVYSIALVKLDTPTEIALMETQKFLKSLGTYGKSPFIWPLYGIGELPQAFCRMSAVFGGTYCLQTKIDSIKINENDRIAICADGQKIECDHIVMDSSYVPLGYSAKSSKTISRAILITNRSVMPAVEEHLSFLTIPPLLGHEDAVRVIEVGPASSACPSGLFVLYLSCPSISTAEDDLLQYTTLLVSYNNEESNKPKLIWSLYYNQIEDIIFEDVNKNMFIPSMPDGSLGFELAVEEAEKIFHTICPEEEFMLPVPNSEDIIWGNDEKNDDNVNIADNMETTEAANLFNNDDENNDEKNDDNVNISDNMEVTEPTGIFNSLEETGDSKVEDNENIISENTGIN